MCCQVYYIKCLMHWALGRMCLTYSNIGRYAIIWTASIPSALCLSLSSNIFLRIFFRMVQTANDRWQRRLSSFTRPTWPWCFSFRCNICFYHCHFTWAYGNNCPCNVQATLNMIVRLSTCASERRKKKLNQTMYLWIFRSYCSFLCVTIFWCK